MPKEGYTLARLHKIGENFEILVDPEKSLKAKLGEKISINKILLYDEIYKDAKKGIRASEASLKKAFNTTDPFKIAEIILNEGELQITADQRKKLIEEKKKQIIDFISKNSIDPRTNLPHPPTRIENALKEIGVSIDPFIDAKEQATAIIEKLRTILPLKVGLTKLAIRLPGDIVGKAYGTIRNYGKIIQEEWQKDGSWICLVEITAGLHIELIEKLNSLSSGRVETKIIEKK